MLTAHDMDGSISTFKEFEDVNEAERAVRALHDAGYEDVETYNLSAHLHQIDDVGSASEKKTWLYLVNGISLGVLGGSFLGILLFYVPAYVMEMKHADQIAMAGVVVCVVAFAMIGAIEALVLAKRATLEPTSSNGSASVGVQVHSRDANQLKVAKDILARFGERPRWFYLRAAVFRSGI